MYPHHYWTKACRLCKWTYSIEGYRPGVCDICAPWWRAPSELIAARRAGRQGGEGGDTPYCENCGMSHGPDEPEKCIEGHGAP